MTDYYVSGYIKDQTGSYNICYYFAGTVICCTCTLFLLDYFIKEMLWKRKQGAQSQTEQQNRVV